MRITILLLCLASATAFCFSPVFAQNTACTKYTDTPIYLADMLAQKYEMELNMVKCQESPPFHFSYGYILERLGKYENALAHYKRSVVLDPSSVKYYTGVADVLRYLGKNDDAIGYYQLALERQPHNKRLENRLILLGIGEATLLDRKNMVLHGDFYIDRREVSIREFKAFKKDYAPPTGYSAEMPATNISFHDAEVFAKEQGKRLCSEKEWLIALAKSSPDIEQSNLYREYHSKPYAVDSDSSWAGAQNLIGNVAEWVVTDKTCGYIGGHFYSATMLQADMDDLSKVVVDTTGSAKNYVGLRLCMDAASMPPPQPTMQAEQQGVSVPPEKPDC